MIIFVMEAGVHILVEYKYSIYIYTIQCLVDTFIVHRDESKR